MRYIYIFDLNFRRVFLFFVKNKEILFNENKEEINVIIKNKINNSYWQTNFINLVDIAIVKKP